MKLQAEDGKNRLTDVADTEHLFRIIQSIPSPKAEPFKLWIAQLELESKTGEKVISPLSAKQGVLLNNENPKNIPNTDPNEQ